jgi:HlyD family secretion protein
MFKNKTIIPLLVAAVAVIAVIVILLGGTKTSVASGANTATVTTVTRAESIDASGYIQAQSYASLGWKTSGTVASVPISAGDHVKAGDVLMSLQITSANANVISAQADLIDAQKQHNSLQYPDGETIAAVQKKLASAYSAWDKARDDLSSALSGKSSYGTSKKK